MNDQISHSSNKTQKEVIGILSWYFIKSFLGIKIKTKLFNLNEIIYIVLPILNITSIWRSVFMRLSRSNKISETTYLKKKFVYIKIYTLE